TDVFVWQLNAATGAFTRAAKVGGTLADVGNAIAVTAKNVYVTGSFNGTADFNPGSGVANLVSKGATDAFVLKLTAKAGCVWAKQLGGTKADAGTAIAVDASGNVYTTGSFAGVADFNPGGGVSKLTSKGGNDVYVSKLSSSGAFVWAKKVGGSGN